MTRPSRLKDRCAIVGVGLSEYGKVGGKSAIGFTLTGIKRAGANLIFTYHALDAVRWLQ